MKVVIDSNQMRNPLLRSFLEKSQHNFAVITDHCAMEAYKGNSRTGIIQSMEILSEYPSQVLVLKSSITISGLRGRESGLQRRLIDEKQTAEFPQFIQELKQIENIQNNQNPLLKGLHDHEEAATTYLQKMLNGTFDMDFAIEKIKQNYSRLELSFIRKNEVPPLDMINKITIGVFDVATIIHAKHPYGNIVTKRDEFKNTFIFRLSLCTYLLCLRWAANGGIKKMSREKVRNDLVDMYFVAYATFFDGLMTAEKKVLAIHQEARLWLSALYGCTLPSGFFGWQKPQVA